MTATVLSGKPLAAALRAELEGEVAELAVRDIPPTLAVVVATDDGASHWYVRSLARSAERAGIACRVVALGAAAERATIVQTLRELSSDPAIHGLILQTPLPPGVRSDGVVEHIAPGKDVDGANPVSLGRLAVGRPAFAPATAEAVIRLLEHHGVALEGRHVAVVGRSTVVGKPLLHLLLQRNATVTVCHSRTVGLADRTRSADVVVAAVGRPALVTAEHVAPHAVVIDVGTNALDDGTLVGDVDPASVAAHVAALSPLPGGVGVVTTALVLLHTVRSAQRSAPAVALTSATVG